MSETVQANPKNSISERLLEILDQLTADQIRFVIARQDFTTDKEAAESIDLKPDTVYHWKSRDRAPIGEAIKLMIGDGLIVAHHLRRRNLAKAMAVKVAGLDEADEVLRQRVATEIIEWEMGRAKQSHELELRSLDLSQLSETQLKRIAGGEELLRVLATPGTG